MNCVVTIFLLSVCCFMEPWCSPQITPSSTSGSTRRALSCGPIACDTNLPAHYFTSSLGAPGGEGRASNLPGARSQEPGARSRGQEPGARSQEPTSEPLNAAPQEHVRAPDIPFVDQLITPGNMQTSCGSHPN